MNVNEKAVNDLNNSTRELSKQLAMFSYDQFNAKPKTGGWTPGETAEHLLLLEISINKIIAGPVKPAMRAADEKIHTFKMILENLGKLFVSPVSIIPSDTIKDPATITQKIQAQRHMLVHSIEHADLNQICLLTQHPNLGDFTRLEWIYFSIYHMQRHIEQLKLQTKTLKK